MTTIAPSCLIGFSSFLQVTRTTVKSWMGRNLAVSDEELMSKLHLIVWKNPHRLIKGETL